jgi:uncharacterized protein (TIGR02453 family)
MSGFSPQVFEWFAGLERDNSKEYFTATRDFYEDSVRGEMEALLHELGGDVKVFRQQRDIRFSADKSPYKTRTYGVAGPLYVAISAQGLYAGTGYYMLARDQLDRYREAVVADGSGLATAVKRAEDAGLEVVGEALKTAPRGYPKDHPLIELLRRKQLIAGAALPGKGGISRERALEHARGVWEAAEPMVAWLNAHVGPSTLPPENRRR